MRICIEGNLDKRNLALLTLQLMRNPQSFTLLVEEPQFDSQQWLEYCQILGPPFADLRPVKEDGGFVLHISPLDPH